jgi:hypothetical protein
MRHLLLALLMLPLVSADPARADELRITRADCDRLVVHEAAPDVAYRPGVDVHGKPVVAADLDGGAPRLRLDEITIPLTLDVLQRGGAAGRRSALEGKTSLGTLVMRQGRAYLDGEPLVGWEQEVLVDACRKLGVR